MATVPMSESPAIPDGQAQGAPEVGDLLVSYLEQIGVKYVFGIPGGAIEPFYNAMARSRRRGGLRPVVARHESGAAFMADGYARQTGTLGVCCATTGPGATNLITGVASAYESHTPLLVITAQTALTNFGRGAFQESSCTGVNTVGMFQYCTRYNTLVSHAEQFERKLIAALMSARQSPAGPVHLSIPTDVLRSPVHKRAGGYDVQNLTRAPELLDDDAVAKLCEEIGRAGKVVFVIGEDCSEAIGTILELATRVNGVILTTPQGKGLVSPYHPLFRGVVGFAGHSSANEALGDPKVDTVVAVGTSLGEWASDGWDPGVLLNERLLHVASSEDDLTRSPMARLHVRGRIATVFQHVLEHLASPAVRITGGMTLVNEATAGTQSGFTAQPIRRFRMDDEASYEDDSAPIKPQRLMRELPRLCPPNTRFLADTGNSAAWAIHYLHPFDRRSAGRRKANGGIFRSALEYASMGWAIGAAVGTALGCPSAPVVCITGDGSLLMSGQEITVAVQERLAVVFVVLNDGALGMVKHGQRLAHSESIGFELPAVDFSALAKALGAQGHVVRSPQDFLDLDMGAICRRPGPTLLDIRIDREEVPPITTRMRVLGDIR